MKKYKWIIILLNLIFLMIYFNHSIIEKETLIKNGNLVLLELTPVDPRSLMQGDYMALRYKISQNNDSKDLPKRGYCIVTLDSNGIANKVRFQKGLTPLSEKEYPIVYTSPDKWEINIGAASFFFQEGESKKYEKAKYGGLRIDKDGNSLLVGLFDEQRKSIE